MNRIFIHASAVGWRGQATLIPGRSFSGKTTLVAELTELVVICQYKKDMRWQPQILSAGAGVSALLANIVETRKQSADILSALQKAALTAVSMLKRAGQSKSGCQIYSERTEFSS